MPPKIFFSDTALPNHSDSSSSVQYLDLSIAHCLLKFFLAFVTILLFKLAKVFFTKIEPHQFFKGQNNMSEKKVWNATHQRLFCSINH